MPQDFITRNAAVHAHDAMGFWTVRAEGDAGTVYVCARSAEVAYGVAVYAATFGESSRRAWIAPGSREEVQSMDAPWSISYRAEEEAWAEFGRLEGIYSAAMRGTLLSLQDEAPDDMLTEVDWSALDRGAVVYPHRLGQGLAVVMDLYGVARIIHEGVRYTDADGNHITIISEA